MMKRKTNKSDISQMLEKGDVNKSLFMRPRDCPDYFGGTILY